MKEVVMAVDIELSKEETKTLYKAKLILKELEIKLKKIDTKRKPNSDTLVEKAHDIVSVVMNDFGAWIDGDTDSEVQELNDKCKELEELEKSTR